MFLKITKQGYNRDGEQFAHGYFLCLVSDKNNQKCNADNTRAFVCFTKMSPFGHFVMGKTHKFGQQFILSGSYGQDGLIMDVETDIFEKCHKLPEELFDKWAHGGGWNSAGNEAADMRKFGLELLKLDYPHLFNYFR